MGFSDIYYNNTDKPIFIVLDWHADPAGGPAIRDLQICIAPGHSIDFTSIGFCRVYDENKE